MECFEGLDKTNMLENVPSLLVPARIPPNRHAALGTNQIHRIFPNRLGNTIRRESFFARQRLTHLQATNWFHITCVLTVADTLEICQFHIVAKLWLTCTVMARLLLSGRHHSSDKRGFMWFDFERFGSSLKKNWCQITNFERYIGSATAPHHRHLSERSNNLYCTMT